VRELCPALSIGAHPLLKLLVKRGRASARVSGQVEAGAGACHSPIMQQKTDGRVVRLLTKHLAAEDGSLEQWFLVAIGDDDKAKEAVSKAANVSDEIVEIIGHIPAPTLASWGMTDGELRLVLPGEPISG
jgi:hypothetical protein